MTTPPITCGIELAERCSRTMPMNWTTEDVYACTLPYGHEGSHKAPPGVTSEHVVHGGAQWPEPTTSPWVQRATRRDLPNRARGARA